LCDAGKDSQVSSQKETTTEETIASDDSSFSERPPQITTPHRPLVDEESIPYETPEIKLRWLHVFIVSLVITGVFTALTFFIVWLVGRSYSIVWAFLDWIFFVECGVLFTFGGCLGTWKQSFSINALSRRIFKSEKLTGADTKLAIGSSYSYVLTGVFLGLISLILFLVL